MTLYRVAVGLVFAFYATLALAQSTDTFRRTGDLTRARKFHTATLLADGRVLIVGGSASDCDVWASAELYDPSTGTFIATGDMAAARDFHTATALPNGKVLIAGGNGACSSSDLTSAELYDPATGTFAFAGDMNSARRMHTATLLDNGLVLIAGGVTGRYSYDTTQVRTAELFDPAAGTFAVVGDLTEAGAQTATLLPDGKVLITRSFNFGIRNHAELYDPLTRTFARTVDPTGPYLGVRPVATLLMNGKVLIAGGSLGDLGGSEKAELYDPGSGAFSTTGEMAAGVDAWLTATLLPEGKALIVGRSSRVLAGSAQLYNPVTGSFSDVGDSQSAEGHAATLLPDGTVLLSGGWVCCGHTLSTAEIYLPAVLTRSPLLFTLAGVTQGAILHANTHQPVSPADPAVAGEALELYLTGLVKGSVIPPRVAIGGRASDVLWFGVAPGFADLSQVNVRVPSGVAPGPAVPVRLTYLGRPSNEVTAAIN